MVNEKVIASVTLKSKSGLSIFKDIDKFSFSTLDDFRPEADNIEQVSNLLIEAGFKIETQTEVGISFSGPKELFESEFSVTIRPREVKIGAPGAEQRAVSFFEASQPMMISDRIAPLAETVQLAIPGVPFHNTNPAAPNPPYYFLNVLNDVPVRLNVAALHAAGITGAGVRVSMVDTGFITRVTENHMSGSPTQVTVDHAIRHMQGVWLSTDPSHTGTNYFTGGNFAGNVITLGTPLPGANTQVEVVYSCLHPHYLAQGYNIDDIRAVGGLDENTDEFGHGTAMAANALAVAPGVTFSFVKYSDGGSVNNFPLAGFQAAVQNQNPDIITCSWGTLGGPDNALLLEIANAVANGIVVIFAAGNGHTDNPAANVQSLAQPGLISVGGAYPIQGGGFRASNYASSYDSFVYTNPQRHCPDVIGLVGERPWPAVLIMFPTEPDNDMDRTLASWAFPNGDNTAVNDGWCVCSGTSAAAPQIAGIVALLLEQHPNLTPMAVKNILENSALDIQTGSSNSAGPDNATLGWDAATGFGLVDGQAALNFLQQGRFNAYIRDNIEDNGTEPVVANRLWASPDIIVRAEEVDDPQEMLGITVKHRHDLSDEVEDGQDNYVYLRVQNRGTVAGSCTTTVYFTNPGMLPNPASWQNIGQIDIQDLEPGEFRVVGPLIWQDAKIPTSGHFCLINILDSPNDPAPDLTAIASSQDFTKMVRDSNNVAWKNITIVDIIPGGSSSFSFYMEGPLGTYHQADLQVDLTNFAPGAIVLVRVVKRLIDTAILNNMTISHESKLFTTLNHLGNIGAVESMDFKSNERTKVIIYFSVPENTLDGDYPIVATLLVDGAQVGSFTNVVRISHFAFVGNKNTREVHRRECSWIMKMSPYNKVAFGDLGQAYRRKYDNCAYCIGESLR
ncbi:MAG: S8 family serine peptidase [Candidatus Hodarchaeota archaeon]